MGIHVTYKELAEMIRLMPDGQQNEIVKIHDQPPPRQGTVLAVPSRDTPPSAAYISGYRDGFSGTWVSPVQWAILRDYRAGWQAGEWDRAHNAPNKFP